LGGLVLPLSVVEDPAHRRVGQRGYLHQVHVELTSHVQRLGEGTNPQLAPLGVYQAHLARPDTLVDPEVTPVWSGDAASLLALGDSVLETIGLETFGEG
jgi:hypothetical protein